MIYSDNYLHEYIDYIISKLESISPIDPLDFPILYLYIRELQRFKNEGFTEQNQKELLLLHMDLFDFRNIHVMSLKNYQKLKDGNLNPDDFSKFDNERKDNKITDDIFNNIDETYWKDISKFKDYKNPISNDRKQAISYILKNIKYTNIDWKRIEPILKEKISKKLNNF